jgi:hypothetical protein
MPCFSHVFDSFDAECFVRKHDPGFFKNKSGDIPIQEEAFKEAAAEEEPPVLLLFPERNHVVARGLPKLPFGAVVAAACCGPEKLTLRMEERLESLPGVEAEILEKRLGNKPDFQ